MAAIDGRSRRLVLAAGLVAAGLVGAAVHAGLTQSPECRPVAPGGMRPDPAMAAPVAGEEVVAIGFARTREGAVAAAAGFVTAGQGAAGDGRRLGRAGGA